MTIQTTQDAGRSVRLETMLAPSTTLSELVIIRNLIDSLLAGKPSEEIEANLYSARHHMVRAIKEIAAVKEAA
jgi:hypothetical protein